MTTSALIVLILAVLLAAAALQIVLLLRRNRALLTRLKLAETRLRSMNREFDTLRHRLQELQDFRNSMGEAELTTRLQQPRLTPAATAPDTAGSRGEKYTFIHAMSEKGMSGREIASILAISTEEVEQVLALTAFSAGHAEQAG